MHGYDSFYQVVFFKVLLTAARGEGIDPEIALTKSVIIN